MFYSWSCIQTEHVVYALTTSDLTKDCPICSQPVQPEEDIDRDFILTMLSDAAERMNLDGPPTYFYNVTQTVLFHPTYGIKVCAPGNEIGLPGQVPGWDL